MKGKGKKPTLLTFHEGDEEDAIDHEAVHEAEQIAHEKLERHLSCCMKCGDSKFCKIDRNGNHVHLTFQQLSSWVAGLVNTQCILDPIHLTQHTGCRTKWCYP